MTYHSARNLSLILALAVFGLLLSSPSALAQLSFAPAVSYGSGGALAKSVTVADLNADGFPDIVVANNCAISGCSTAASIVGVLSGNGDGTFQTAVSYSIASAYGVSIAVADVNGDGKPDIIVGAFSISNSGIVDVMLGNGDGTFQSGVAYNSGGDQPTSLAVVDLNGDGKPDIIIANGCNSSGCTTTTSGNVGVLLGNGDGTFQTAMVYEFAGNQVAPGSIEVADLNGDGKPDIATIIQCAGGCPNGNIAVSMGNGDGTFQSPVTYSAGLGAGWIAVGDVNEDGKLDLIVTTLKTVGTVNKSAVGVLLGNGDGTFQAVATYLAGVYQAGSLALGDLNGDNELDIIVTNNAQSGAVSVLLGNGDGTFQSPMTYSSGGKATVSVVAAEVNRDGKPDIIVANSPSSTLGEVSVLINTSRYPTATALISSLNPSSFGQVVNLTANVTRDLGGTPTGTINFIDGTTSFGISSLSQDGVANLSASSLAVGTHAITAVYSGDSNFAVSTSPVLTQVVQGAIVLLSSTKLSFGEQTVHTSSSAQGVTLTNTGNAAVMDIQVSGSNSADFTVTNGCGISLEAGASCTITVIFTPSANGTRTASFSISDSAPGSPQLISLSGVGVSPAVTLSPSSLTFPTQVVFTYSAAQTVTLKNTGAGILNITKIVATSEFIQSNTCGTSVASGASCSLTIRFKPTAINGITGSVYINDNAPSVWQKLVLTGTGTYVQLNPATLNFGNQPVSTRSLSKRITLSNKGSIAVNLTAIGLAGADPGDFAETNNCGSTVAGGASCFITVTFTPTATGQRTATLSITDNGGGSPQTAAVSGTGTP